MRGSSLQWPSPKSSSQILSFQSAQEQEGSHTLCPGFSQKKLALDYKQGRNQYPVTNHCWKPNDVVSSPEAKVFPISSSILPPILESSFVASTSPVSSVSVLPPYSSVVGFTDLKSSPNISSGTCQLTIFYNGSVCVYDNVTPGKAQAIMLLAGNGDSENSTTPPMSVPLLSKVQPTTQPVTDTPVPDQSKGFPGSISLPKSLSEGTLHKQGAMSTKIKDPKVPKSGARVGVGGVKPISKVMPQARKASLARFLEKRKERVTAASPYIIKKSSPESSAANSSFSTPLPATN